MRLDITREHKRYHVEDEDGGEAYGPTISDALLSWVEKREQALHQQAEWRQSFGLDASVA